MATDAVYSQQPSKAAPTNQSYFQASKQLNQGVSSRGSMRSGASNKHGENLGGTVVRRVAKERHRTQAGKGQRTLAKNIDPSSYRNSMFHNICTEVLEKGFHESFTELFFLVEKQRSDHAKAGQASILLEPLIEHNITKLEYLKVQLTLAEDAARTKDLDVVYMAQRNLAQYFEHTDDAKRTNDRWLSDHFYGRCLETGSMVTGDNRRKEGEAHCHVGLALENRGDMVKASLHMVTFCDLARSQNWYTENGDSLLEIACEHLRRLYTSISEEVHSTDPLLAISYLKKAHERAKEGGDTYQEGKSCYRLGNAFEEQGDPDSAITYHRQYLESCKHHGDDAGVGRAYEALAKSFESKGDTENAVKFLEMYVAVSEQANLAGSLAEACSAIGIMHNTLGNYEKAVDYCGQCYKICNELDNPAALHSARVQYGIAKGHQLMGDFSQLLQGGPLQDTLPELIGWKDSRANPYAPETEEEDEDVEEDVEEEDEEEVEEAEEGAEEEQEGSDEDGGSLGVNSSEEDNHPS